MASPTPVPLPGPAPSTGPYVADDVESSSTGLTLTQIEMMLVGGILSLLMAIALCFYVSHKRQLRLGKQTGGLLHTKWVKARAHSRVIVWATILLVCAWAIFYESFIFWFTVRERLWRMVGLQLIASRTMGTLLTTYFSVLLVTVSYRMSHRLRSVIPAKLDGLKIPWDKAKLFHMYTAYSICVASAIHIACHAKNMYAFSTLSLEQLICALERPHADGAYALNCCAVPVAWDVNTCCAVTCFNPAWEGDGDAADNGDAATGKYVCASTDAADYANRDELCMSMGTASEHQSTRNGSLSFVNPIPDALMHPPPVRQPLHGFFPPGELSQFALHLGTIPGITGWIMAALILCMFVTAMKSMRMRNFEVFYYVHRTAFVVFICLMFHGTQNILNTPTAWYWVLPSVLLFIVEKSFGVYLRWKPRRLHHVEVYRSKGGTSAGAIKLMFERPKDYDYKPGDWFRIQCYNVSKTEWHPVAAISSPLDTKLAFMYAVRGNWTSAVAELCTNSLAPAANDQAPPRGGDVVIKMGAPSPGEGDNADAEARLSAEEGADATPLAELYMNFLEPAANDQAPPRGSDVVTEMCTPSPDEKEAADSEARLSDEEEADATAVNEESDAKSRLYDRETSIDVEVRGQEFDAEGRSPHDRETSIDVEARPTRSSDNKEADADIFQSENDFELEYYSSGYESLLQERSEASSHHRSPSDDRRQSDSEAKNEQEADLPSSEQETAALEMADMDIPIMEIKVDTVADSRFSALSSVCENNVSTVNKIADPVSDLAAVVVQKSARQTSGTFSDSVFEIAQSILDGAQIIEYGLPPGEEMKEDAEHSDATCPVIQHVRLQVGSEVPKEDESLISAGTPGNIATISFHIDGPFGSCGDQFHEFESIMCLTAGIGVTPMLSILETVKLDKLQEGGEYSHIRKFRFHWVAPNAAMLRCLLPEINDCIDVLGDILEVSLYQSCGAINPFVIRSARTGKLRQFTPRKGRIPTAAVFASAVMAEVDDADIGIFASGSAGFRRAARFETERHRYDKIVKQKRLQFKFHGV